ncbi:hypothetical protein UFOVP469_32 [uncultured Caudovirales phage]|uniref:Uncharacterized protein n=1 Tax=uncultured Caudovirales phage TaxID=2100421 RepID=A0A6J5R4E3_9CAUD|nr:hypothetical protein UFOVP469_32 [uncultured Caudovirales phage]CAB4189586.1 hypothetical protein UFOVP1200_5 [uncultured Caudovirales phage]
MRTRIIVITVVVTVHVVMILAAWHAIVRMSAVP